MKTKTAENKYVSRVKDYKQTFSTSAGKRVLYDLMKTHNILSSHFDHSNELKTVFGEGERNVVLRILSILKTNPEKLMAHIENIQEENLV
jgi:hypothetical protein